MTSPPQLPFDHLPSDDDPPEPPDAPDAPDGADPTTPPSSSSSSSSGATRTEPVVVFTDGACSGNPGPGGWGWAVSPDGHPRGSGGESPTTNQRMELRAVLEALRTLDPSKGPVQVVSDSTYVVNCFRDGWWERWERNGWRNAKKQPVANADLWRPLVDLVRAGNVTFRWVKGHSGDPMNDLVDRLAVEAAPTR